MEQREIAGDCLTSAHKQLKKSESTKTCISKGIRHGSVLHTTFRVVPLAKRHSFPPFAAGTETMYVCTALPRPQDCEHAPRGVKAPTQFRFGADRGKNKLSEMHPTAKDT